MRGKDSAPLPFRSTSGITPAYAGKSGQRTVTLQPAGDHPRVCGEKAWNAGLRQSRGGSPPRMRGKERIVIHGYCPFGITPAYAGKRPDALTETAHRGDHPRVCGEKFRPPFWLNFRQGSPPRMRGKVKKSPALPKPCGITPAYAGKRLPPCAVRGPGADHPRVCGEKKPRLGPRNGTPGSPPRMRGKVNMVQLNGDYTGITPAYAGKSTAWNQSCRARWDHPRVCGEKPSGELRLHDSSGSPPRMRGKVKRSAVGKACAGITPAYAGKRWYSRLFTPICWDHPRVCGEKRASPVYFARLPGSPPRMRGKVHMGMVCISLGRITPAYAGKRE